MDQQIETPATSLVGIRLQSQNFTDPQINYDLEMPALPEEVKVAEELGIGACKWLDDYVQFSRLWSPRAFEDFHEAGGLFVLSTVAARRVYTDMVKQRYPNLQIALTARTSLYAKSSTAEIALQTLNQANLAFFLAADSATPQKFVADLTPRLPENYDELIEDLRNRALLRYGFAGQRGWYYDEFGQHVAAMMRDGGFMADFRGLLRRFDDTPERYEYGSIGRGNDIVERPYLALLANITPDDLRPFAQRRSALWGDGFLARFALITPPEGERRRERFPIGERSIPPQLIIPLLQWHNRLHVPEVNVSGVLSTENKPSSKKTVVVSNKSPTCLSISPDVREAFYAYHDGLLDLVERNTNHDLDGNYARNAEKALRIATLLASLSGSDQITLTHWARSQAIAERWRAGLHELYRQINEPEPSEERIREERLLQAIQRHGSMTAAQAARYVRNLSSIEAGRILDGLVHASELEMTESPQRRSRKYDFPRYES